ncbi:MAG: aryl-sulfate sulfotransferase [Promethearchaeota archaeon]|jgi:hypothetical protein
MSKNKVIIGIIVIFAGLSVFFYIIFPNYAAINNPLDVDYISEGKYAGNYLVSPTWGNVVIIDDYGNIKWQRSEEEFFLHDSDILSHGNGTILMADTTNNRVIEVEFDNTSNIIWSWDALNNSDINWTKFSNDRGWDDLSFLEEQYPFISSWTHLNDVDFINGSHFGKNYDSILISLRNLNLVIEVNYSNTKEILWSYGDPSNSTVLNQQHNPDQYETGNVVICDTGNNRIIEVNKTTNEVVWELKLEFPYGKLRIARDCDDIGNGLRLITDSGNNRLLVYDMNSSKIIKEIKSILFGNPYDADLLDNGDILVSSSTKDLILIIDYETGLVIKVIGFPYKWIVPYSLIFLILGYFSIEMFQALKSSTKKKLRKIFDFQVYRQIIYLICTFLVFYFLDSILSFLWLFTFTG